MRVSSPGENLSQSEIDAIQRDVEKIDRRLGDLDEVYLDVRVGKQSGNTSEATLELEYRRNHLVATSTGGDARHAIRNARDELLQQIEGRQRGSHSDYRKHS